VIRRATPLAFSLATVTAWVLFLGVLADRVELFVAAIPLAVGLLSLTRQQPPRFALRQQLSAERVSEGDQILVSLTVAAEDPLPMIEILAALPPMLEVASGNNRVVLTVAAGREWGWSFQVRCPARGHFDLGLLYVRLSDLSGLSTVEMRQATPRVISVYPAIERIRHVPQPMRTQFSFGNYVSPRLGEGIEPGEIRPFVPGDRTRHINWRPRCGVDIFMSRNSTRSGTPMWCSCSIRSPKPALRRIRRWISQSAPPPGSQMRIYRARTASDLSNSEPFCGG
jgi:uncharacterized protein (DUF58 family)